MAPVLKWNDTAPSKACCGDGPHGLAHGRLIVPGQSQLEQPARLGAADRHAGMRLDHAACRGEPGADGPFAGRAAIGGENDALVGLEEGDALVFAGRLHGVSCGIKKPAGAAGWRVVDPGC
jgi:hypothetical protein